MKVDEYDRDNRMGSQGLQKRSSTKDLKTKDMRARNISDGHKSRVSCLMHSSEE